MTWPRLVPHGVELPLNRFSSDADFDSFRNYCGVESDQLALETIQGYIGKGWIKEFATLQQLADHVGGRPTLSKFACIVKDRADGLQKRRIILDVAESGVMEASKNTYKSSLPRQTDLLSDIRSLQSEARPAEAVELFVLDAEDAFWQIPLHPSERGSFCAQLHRPDGTQHWLSFERTAQGGMGSPSLLGNNLRPLSADAFSAP